MSEPIVQERVLEAPVSRVFEAWTAPESLSKWMGPGPDFGPASVSLDVRVGGTVEIVMHGEDRDYRQSGEFLEIVPDERLVFRWVSHWMPEGEQETRVTVELEAVGEKQTRLRLTHDELPESSSYAGHEDGWKTILDRLEHTLG